MKHGMRKYGPWYFSMGAFGECLPYEDNHVSLHPTKFDRFGIPQLVYNVTFRANDLRMKADARQQGEMMLRRAGLRNVPSYDEKPSPGQEIQAMGRTHMGAGASAAGRSKGGKGTGEGKR